MRKGGAVVEMEEEQNLGGWSVMTAGGGAVSGARRECGRAREKSCRPPQAQRVRSLVREGKDGSNTTWKLESRRASKVRFLGLFWWACFKRREVILNSFRSIRQS